MPETQRANLNHWQRAAYGFGDFGFNLYWTTVSFFILYYYTDVVGLSGTVAGLIFLTAMLWDSLIDPVVGYMAQRTKSRWGCYRPYFLFGAIPLALSLVLTFYNPDLEGSALIASVLLAHMFFRTAYTVVNIPYSALSAKITQSTEIRNNLSAWRISFATIGSALVAYSTLRLVEAFGQGDASYGFLLTAALYAGLSIPAFLILFFTVQETLNNRVMALRDTLQSSGLDKRWLNKGAVCRFGQFEVLERVQDIGVQNSRIGPLLCTRKGIKHRLGALEPL